MDARYHEALEDCLVSIERGADMDSCLSRYPDLAGELRPVLETALLASGLKNDHVPNAAMQRSRTRVLGEAAKLRSRPRAKPSFLRFPRLALVVLAFVLIVFLSWRGLLVASAKSLPGDPLYHVKRAAENVSMRVVPNNEAKLNIQAEINERRVGEVITLLKLGRVEPVQFEGVVTEQSPDRWIVDGVPVHLNQSTAITGKIENGMVVEVVGQTQPEGWVIADSIWLHSYELIGMVESISSTRWIISGTEVQISHASQLDPAIHIGDKVIVLVEIENNQILHAEAILRLLQPSIIDEIEPSPTPSPVQGATPAPQTPLVFKDVEFSGTVGSISALEWQVGGTKIIITPDTKIQDKISVGDQVRVHAKIAQDGSVLALEIVLEASQGDSEGVDKTEEPSNSGSDEHLDEGKDNGSGSEEGGTGIGDETIGGSEDGSSNGDSSGGDHIGEPDDGTGGGTGEGSGSGDGGDEKIEPGDPGGDGSGENLEPGDGSGGGEVSGGESDQKIEPTTEGSLINPGDYHSGLDPRMEIASTIYSSIDNSSLLETQTALASNIAHPSFFGWVLG